MGSWFKTCALTNMPIMSGDEVYVVVLESNPSKGSRCESSSFWKPVLLPFTARYNDYGAGGDIDFCAFNVIQEALKKVLVEDECKPKYDTQIKKDTFDVEVFFEAVHDNRLKTKTVWNESLVDFVMLKKTAVDSLLEKFEPEFYISMEFQNKKYKDMLKEVPAFVDKIIDTEDHPEMILREIDELNHFNDIWYHNSTLVTMNSLIRVIRLIRENMNKVDAQKLIELFILGNYINLFFDCTRRIWTPMCFEGSQSTCYEQYSLLAQIIEQEVQLSKSEDQQDQE